MSRRYRPAHAARGPGHACRVSRLEACLAGYLARTSVGALRISLGLVILGFGFLKFFPGASPAEPLVMQTTAALTFGLVDGTLAVVATALLETTIGVILLTGRGLRAGMVVMGGWLVGILTPVVLFPGQMFPGGLPTLAAQYVLKDVILAAAAAAVVAAAALGARMTPPVTDDRRRSGHPERSAEIRAGDRATAG